MKNLKIGTKLFILVGFMLAALAAVGTSSMNFMSSMNPSITAPEMSSASWR